MTDGSDNSPGSGEVVGSGDLFHLVVDQAPDTVLVVDGDGKIVFANQRVTALIGYAPGELVGTRVEQLLPESLRAGHVRHREAFAQSPRARSMGAGASLSVLHKNGSEVPVDIALAPVQHGGEPLVCVSLRDATERRRTEVALREAAESVRRATERFERAFGEAPIGMALVGLDGRLQEVNATLAAVVDTSQVNLVGSSLLDHAHPDDRQAVAVALHRARVGEVTTTDCAPRLVTRDGRIVWAKISFASIAGVSGRPAYLIAQFEDTTDRVQAEAALLHQVLHDPLTGLPNRLLLLDRLEQALLHSRATGARTAVLMIDLDRFKLVNDSLGHAAGDRLLVEAASRLQSALRPGDTVARIGGDEFVVVAENVDAANDVGFLARRIRAALGQSVVIDGADLRPTASVGVVMSDAASTPEQLLRDADGALYLAKDRGRDRCEVFDDNLRRRATERLDVESWLRRSLDADEIVVFYQPVVSLRHGGRAVGAEALLRVLRDANPVEPESFLDVAEETGLVVPLGSYVLDHALRDAAERRGADDPSFAVSVNVSARQLASPELVTEVSRLLAHHGVPASALCLELTESVLVDASAAVATRLADLKALGVRLAIDDFGTGWSSLTYLRRFPVDVLKVDRSFVAGIGTNTEDEAIVRAVLSLARELGLTTIAEGVERLDQHAALEAWGCDLAQGFLFGAAAPHRSQRVVLAPGAPLAPALGPP